MKPVTRAAASLVAVVLAGVAEPAAAQAQGLRLQRSLAPPPSAQTRDELPIFLTADRVEGLGAFEVEAVGDAELRRGDTRLTADRIVYFQDYGEVEATGNVRLRVAGDEIAGPRLRLRIDDTTGIFESPTFRFAPRGVAIRGERQRGPTLTATAGTGRAQTVVESRGTAEALRFSGEDQYRLTGGSFTTCKPGQDDWFIEARELDIDMDREIGTARGARLTFLGLSTPRVPWFDFSLNNERKSGFLPPTIGAQNTTGFDASFPFYWNIAPNYDATITPRYMYRRGGQLLTQFRFLQPWALGDVRYEVLPKDRAADDQQRWALAVGSGLNFGNGLTGLVNYQRVSDDNYFRDLSSRLSIATQTFLPQQGLLSYSSPTGLWNATANMQRFQTLQDPQNPVTQPYFREPQILFNGLHQTLGGLDVGMRAEYVNFTNRALVPTGQRATAYPFASLPFVASYGFVIPKAGVSFVRYDLGTPGQFANNPTPTLTVPIASLDTGLYLERDARWFGTDYLQTLEPRLYYLYVPFRDQNDLPIFDTSNADLNFAQLFQENIFAGGDRIANANQLSYAVTSRLVRPSDGQELVRAVAGQRYYFTDQKVFVPGQPSRSESFTPLILGLSGRVAPDWTVDIGVQYRISEGASLERLVTGVRYSPAPASVASVSYRYTAENLTAGAGEINTVDVAAQWPLGRGVYGVGRASYDIVGRKTVELLAGLEYNADCWIVRAVAQRFQTGTGTETTAVFFQLELNGLGRIGSNPIEVLRRSIPGYALLNQAAPALGATDVAPIGGATSGVDSRGLRSLQGGTSAYRYYD